MTLTSAIDLGIRRTDVSDTAAVAATVIGGAAIPDRPHTAGADIELDRIAEPETQPVGIGNEPPEILDGHVEEHVTCEYHRFHAAHDTATQQLHITEVARRLWAEMCNY